MDILVDDSWVSKLS